MQQVIGGKLYDTNKAIEIAANSGGNGRNDFAWFEEAIYKTDKGQWFLWGQGGPHTRYKNRLSDGCFGYGERLVPLSGDDALAWLESAKVDPEVVAKHFDLEDA